MQRRVRTRCQEDADLGEADGVEGEHVDRRGASRLRAGQAALGRTPVRRAARRGSGRSKSAGTLTASVAASWKDLDVVGGHRVAPAISMRRARMTIVMRRPTSVCGAAGDHHRRRPVSNFVCGTSRPRVEPHLAVARRQQHRVHARHLAPGGAARAGQGLRRRRLREDVVERPVPSRRPRARVGAGGRRRGRRGRRG